MKLDPSLDPKALSERFAVKHRVQIPGFLTPEEAGRLEATLVGFDAWHLVMNDRDRHIDLPVSYLPELGLDRIDKAKAQATSRAASEFQYIYENYPVADACQSGNLSDPVLKSFFEFMNGAEVMAFLQAVTGLQIDYCDMQATKYGPGHVLTAHDDDVAGKHRQFAYVLGMTRNWASIWGGQLQFLTEEDRIEESFVPAFNTLSIFAIPVPHHVTQIASFAPVNRISLTGWYRQNA